jgi:hypothetical protein
MNEAFKIRPTISDQVYAVKAERTCLRCLKNRVRFFNRQENDTVYLLDESGVFGVAVKVDSIDWSKVCS